MNFTANYQSAYRKLNVEQQQAVDAIDGPVMVLAGPGTGKTTLLSMRVANILQKTDALPQNILCLTFTEAASTHMTEAMVKLFGAEGYNVPALTFHAFCANVMGRFNQYFYRGATFAPADELTKLEILNSILRALPPKNPLSGVYDDTASQLTNVQKAISHVKREGALSPENLRDAMRENKNFIKFCEPILATVYNDKISKATIAKAAVAYEKMATYTDQTSALARAVINDFADAINATTQSGKTTTLTAFKNQYFNAKLSKMNDGAKTEKTLALADVYEKYDQELMRRKLYDFDDMIVKVVAELEDNPELRAELQEQYQYILVDEFQDTNAAQMRILHALADAPDSNIMVVGDDDQAIYSFQGANVNNLVDFKLNYPKVQLFQLFQNYRSDEKILRLAEETIDHSKTRIKVGFFETLKTLLAAGKSTDAKPLFCTVEDSVAERAWVAQSIAEELSENPQREIAVIARAHKDLLELVPFLQKAGLHNIEYQNTLNVLASEPVRALAILARVVHYIGVGAHGKANELLPELLSHPAWQIPAQNIWRLSLEVEHKNNWLAEMLERDEFRELANWLIEMSQQVKNLSMENALDILFNYRHKDYYFSEQKLAEQPDEYLNFLTDLITLRAKVREHKTEHSDLATFLEILELYQKYNQTIEAERSFGAAAKVKLMTAHKAKGLEFDSVYVINAVKSSWLKNKGDSFFPSNMHLTIPGNMDENIRLVFVAITRARERLFISAPQKTSTKGEDLTIAPILGNIDTKFITPKLPKIERLETAWNPQITTVNDDLKTLLKPRLDTYRLNATAVNSFTNLEYAGPEKFLLNNLLRFPSAKSANADYGTAVHNAIKFTHDYFLKNNQKPTLAETEKFFTSELKSFHMLDVDYNYYLAKGQAALAKYLDCAEFNQNQKTEQIFTAQLGEIRLTGKLDLLEIDPKTKTVKIIDHKTGAAFEQFDAGKIKSHTYKQQLLFYKILVENSTNFPGLKVDTAELHFVDTADDSIVIKNIIYDNQELEKFTKLLHVIWHKIQTLDLPDVSIYPADLKGTLKFEEDLIFK